MFKEFLAPNLFIITFLDDSIVLTLFPSNKAIFLLLPPSANNLKIISCFLLKIIPFHVKIINIILYVFHPSISTMYLYIVEILNFLLYLNV